ncbi:PREDICTED: phospholipase A1-IIdelta-like [Tarenaya hassleriana]|uniref:phospholipase A1-IIdelta-like n=1 Tax=Tarenaya hassleriana TaxID=28532 RepID=UPI00053C4285|nr:PREDICTED: phospholipase A1-IIdelta-like [Tarenaya hassleriana]
MAAAEEPTWEDLLGRNNWEGLLNPLNVSLRRLVLRAGDFCQATYDAFVNDPNSAFCGVSRYGKPSFFRKVMLDDADHYDVVSFLYATARVSDHEAFFLKSMSRDSWDRETNWIGYVAVTSDARTAEIGRREIYVVFRGTTRNYEWINVLGAKLTSLKCLLTGGDGNCGGGGDGLADDDDDGPKAMLGWVTIYTTANPRSQFTKMSARSQLLRKIQELLEKYKDEKPSIVLTGHSLGGTLATLGAFDLAENVTGGDDNVPVTAIVFGSPKVGNKELADRIKLNKNLRILHVKNQIDLITRYPGRILGYVSVGTKLKIDTRKSPFLKESHHPGDWHNLQAMLHVAAGWNGEREEFEMRVKRSIALVNKSCDLLKEECLVPPCWWVEKNKGLLKAEDGEWVMATPHDEDLPVAEFHD